MNHDITLDNDDLIRETLLEIKEEEELELLITSTSELSDDKFLYLSTIEVDIPTGMEKIDFRVFNFEGKDFYCYIFEKITK